MGAATSQPVSAAVRDAELQSMPSRSPASTRDLEAPPSSQDLRERHVEGSFSRIGVKVGVAALAGSTLGPILLRPVARSWLLTSVLTGANCAAMVGFFDLARESVTTAVLLDSPVNSLVAGALTGYVWNGIAHGGSRPHAIAGAMLMGSIASVLHTMMPRFYLDKAITQSLLAADLIDDPRGRVRAIAERAPVLPPLTWRMSWDWFEGFALKYLPIRKVSDEEYDEMTIVNPPVKLSFRKGPDEST